MRPLLIGAALMLATPALAGPRDTIDTFQDGIELKAGFESWSLQALLQMFGLEVPRIGVFLNEPKPEPGGVTY